MFIYQVVGSSRPVSLADKGRLPYTEATLLELQRVSNTRMFVSNFHCHVKSKTIGLIPFSTLTHLRLVSLLLDISKQNSPRCDAAERSDPSGAILFAKKIFIKVYLKIENHS